MDEIQQLKDKEKSDSHSGDEWGMGSEAVVEQDKSNEWVWGIALIAIGVLLFLRPITGIMFTNWWALFLIIPGALKLFGALQGNGDNDQLAGGFFMLLIGSVFLFGLSWALIWPFFLIFGGFCVIRGIVKGS